MSTKIIWVLLGLGLLIIYRKRIKSDWQLFQTQRGEWLRDKWENWVKPLFIAAILAIGIRTFLIGPYKIPTGSMIPTLLVGDRIFVDKISFRFKEPERGDIIVFKYPMDRKKDFVKRVVGLSGEKVEIKDGQALINGKKIETPDSFSQRFYYNRSEWDYGKEGQVIDVPPGHFFVLGDNSAASSDSRNWGFVPRKDVIGRAVLIWWPPKRVRLLTHS